MPISFGRLKACSLTTAKPVRRRVQGESPGPDKRHAVSGIIEDAAASLFENDTAPDNLAGAQLGNYASSRKSDAAACAQSISPSAQTMPSRNRLLRIAEEMSRTDPSDQRARFDVATIWTRIGATRLVAGDPTHANEELARAIAQFTPLMASSPANAT